MNTIEIPAIGVCREIPSKWSEMTPEQARVTMRLLWDMESGHISPLEFHVRVLYLLLGIKRTWRSVMWENSIEPLPSRRMPTFFALRKSPRLAVYRHRGRSAPDIRHHTESAARNPYRQPSFAWPADALQDLILVEFRNALIARDEFLNTRQPAALDRMIAFLYRQPSKQANRAGRCIVPIRHETFERDVCHARRIAPWQKQTILMWFSACVKFLQTGTIVVAGEQIDMRTIFSSEETAHDTGPKFTLTDVAYELARDRALGTLNDIDEEGLYTIFQILHHNVKQAKRNAKTH